jgi:hypothetical protein
MSVSELRPAGTGWDLELAGMARARWLQLSAL